MESTVFVIADVSSSSENADRLGEVLRKFALVCQSEPGCVSYEVFRSVERPERYVSIEQYVDAAAFAAHRDSGHFRDIGSGQVTPLVTARDVRMFTGSDPVAPKAD